MARFLLIGLLACAVFVSPAAATEYLGDLDVSFLSLKVNARGEALVSYRKRRRSAARRPGLGRRERARAGSRTAPGEVPVRLHRRLAHARRAATPGRSGTSAGRTTARGSSCSSPPARRPTAPTGRCSAGSGSRRCAASTRFSPSRRHSSSTSRTGRARCPCSRSRRTGRTAPACRGCSAASPTAARPCTASGPVCDEKRSVRPLRLHRHLQLRLRSRLEARHGIVTHQRNGAFCYSFVAQVPPPGYPSSEPRGPGNGERHRVTVMGPGVTPIVQWEGEGLRRYDACCGPGVQQALRSAGRPDDKVCARER